MRILTCALLFLLGCQQPAAIDVAKAPTVAKTAMVDPGVNAWLIVHHGGTPIVTPLPLGGVWIEPRRLSYAVVQVCVGGELFTCEWSAFSGFEAVTAHGLVNCRVVMLAGDSNGDGAVNRIDTALIRSRHGEPVTAANCRCDVNCDGTIDEGDE